MAELRRRGPMTAVICSDAFLNLARTQARVFGVPDMPLIVIPHPLGGIAMVEVKSRAERALPQLLDLILNFCDPPGTQPIGLIPPRWGEATPWRLAANAVMAGCRPEYFPLVMLAVEAMCVEAFNLYGVQTTTHLCAPLLIVNGPVARELNINAGHNAFGPGRQSNSTIGRAIRLALMFS